MFPADYGHINYGQPSLTPEMISVLMSNRFADRFTHTRSRVIIGERYVYIPATADVFSLVSW